ncbi:MAG: hypothetical protein K2I79_03155, partial [Clostridia bacterium]|nr:hypothetical protein [Clostridia bacterium]
MDWYNSLCKKRFFARIDYKIFNNSERACVSISDVSPLNKPPETLMLASFFRCSAAAEEKSIFRPKRINLDEAAKIVGGRRSGVCALAFTHKGAEKAGEIFKDTQYIASYCRPITPCPYNTLVYAVDRNADLSSYSTLILTEEPVLEGAVDMFNIDKDCKVYILEGDRYSMDSRDLPDYNALADIYKAVRSALNEAPARSEFELYRRIGRICGYSTYLAALFIFEDLGFISYGDGGYETVSGVKRKLDDSALYAKLREVGNG